MGIGIGRIWVYWKIGGEGSAEYKEIVEWIYTK
jgi:hypothetical protein